MFSKIVNKDVALFWCLGVLHAALPGAHSPFLVPKPQRLIILSSSYHWTCVASIAIKHAANGNCDPAYFHELLL